MALNVTQSEHRDPQLAYIHGADDADLISLLTALLRWRRLVFGLTVVVVVLVVVPQFFSPREYVSTTSILPETKGTSNAAGLAAQLGVTVPSEASGESPAFYEDLLGSRTILGRIADTTYAIPPSSSPRPLADVLELKGDSPEYRRNKAIAFLSGAVSAAANAKTGIVTVRVKTPIPALSHQIAVNLLAELAAFNRDRRRTNAANERSFAATRLVEATAELRAAEDGLQSFLEHNRGDFRQSPTLGFEHDRLTRQVALKSQTQLTLAEALERARVDEAREAPLFSAIDSPELPLAPEPRPLVLRAIIGVALGLFLGVILALLLEMTRSASLRGETQFAEFQRLRHEALDDLKNPLRIARPSRRQPAGD